MAVARKIGKPRVRPDLDEGPLLEQELAVHDELFPGRVVPLVDPAFLGEELRLLLGDGPEMGQNRLSQHI